MSVSLYARLHRRFGPRVDALTRREMLRTTLAASAGLLLSRGGVAGVLAQTPSGKQRRVVVIGGGFAGLACAYELKSVGYDVTVVEARNRVGGRVLSFADFVPGRNVEGGGELIGSNHPTWVNYAEKFGLEFLDVTEAEDVEFPIILDGKRLSGEEAESLWKEMEEAVAAMNADAGPVDADEPWKTEGADRLDKRTVADWVKSLGCSELCRKGVDVQFTADNGVATDQQSYLGMLACVKGGGLEQYWTDSEVYRCQGGNQQLAHKLAGGIGSDRIVLKLPVKRVKAAGDRVEVRLADGRSIEADDVVLAVAPAVWSRIDFEPALPRTLTPQTGCNVKYLSALKKRFWKDLGLSPDALTNGDVSMTWDGTDNQPGDEPAAMVAFSGGPAAERCRSRSGEAVHAAYRTELEKIYRGYEENLTDKRFMDWPGDEWTKCGYSFPAPGQVTTMGPVLARGLGRVHFAGEHACYKFTGYMEGALNSGVTLARRIAVRDGVAVP